MNEDYILLVMSLVLILTMVLLGSVHVQAKESIRMEDYWQAQVFNDDYSLEITKQAILGLNTKLEGNINLVLQNGKEVTGGVEYTPIINGRVGLIKYFGDKKQNEFKINYSRQSLEYKNNFYNSDSATIITRHNFNQFNYIQSEIEVYNTNEKQQELAGKNNTEYSKTLAVKGKITGFKRIQGKLIEIAFEPRLSKEYTTDTLDNSSIVLSNNDRLELPVSFTHSKNNKEYKLGFKLVYNTDYEEETAISLSMKEYF